MEVFKIWRGAHPGTAANKEHFEVNEKKVVMEFDENGYATTTDKDVVEFYRHRNFPNTFPYGQLPHYWVFDSNGNLIVK